MSALAVRKISEVDRTSEHKWLVESLWTEGAVGTICGHPKTNKSYLALDFAISVASGTPVLDRFAVSDPGAVLLFPAEDSHTAVRERAEGLCRHRSVDFGALELYLIESPVLRLDEVRCCKALEGALQKVRPRLLILDPLIRLHSADENSATEIARVLSFLRHLQRTYKTAVLVVHHARKSSGGDPGLSMRGSTEIRAWSDTNLYMRRRGGLELTIEHRQAASPKPLKLELVTEDQSAVHLKVSGRRELTETPKEKLLRLLSCSEGPLNRAYIRSELALRNQTVSKILCQLQKEGLIEKTKNGYRLLKPVFGETRPADTGALLGSNVVTTGR